MNVPLKLPQLLPVLDLLDGQVVRGVAGRRELYHPLVSPLASGSLPLSIARGLRNLVGHDWLYMADLDAIQGGEPHWSDMQALIRDGFRLLVDAGLRNPDRALELRSDGVAGVVAALETLPQPKALERIVEAVGGGHVLFSLDLNAGCPLGDPAFWGSDAVAIGRRARDSGVGGLIVLDLAGVGVGEGVPTLEICRQLRSADADVGIITGGGVRHLDDVHELLSAGVDSVLVASALHRGTISRDDLATLKHHSPD